MNVKQLEKVFRKGVQHHLAGRLKEASDAYQQILAEVPGHPPSLHLLGVVALQIGQASVAVDLISAAIAGDPAAAAYHNDLGEALRALNCLDDAAAAFRSALELDAEHVGAYCNLGVVEHSRGHFDEAIALYQSALNLAPGELAAMLNLGVAHLDQGNLSAALVALEQSAVLAPDDPAVCLNLGNARLAADDLAGAEAAYRHGLTCEVASAALHTSLARALRAQGKVTEALDQDRQALALQPDLPEAHWNEGLDHLLLGDYAAGWQGFAWRWKAGALPPHDLSGTEWEGGTLARKRLLVHAEQGLGDTLQFIRFLPDLARFHPGELTLLCQPALIPLLVCSGMDALARIVGPGEPMPPHDLRIALLDLPLRLGITLSDLPWQSRYIRPPAEQVALWRSRLRRGNIQKRRVGLVWKGRAGHANDRNRSASLDGLLPFFGLQNVTWISLQKDAAPAEQAALAQFGVADISGDLVDLTEAAAAIEALDLVISVDTALAHLAGAMGKPVWILLPFAPDWRWMLERLDTPWYPSARLFRQSHPGDWRGIVERVILSLEAPDLPLAG